MAMAKCIVAAIFFASLAASTLMIYYGLDLAAASFFADAARDFESIPGGCAISNVYVTRGQQKSGGSNQMDCYDYYTFLFCAPAAAAGERRSLMHTTHSPYNGSSLGAKRWHCSGTVHLSEPMGTEVCTESQCSSCSSIETQGPYSIEETVACWRPAAGASIRHGLPYYCGYDLAKASGAYAGAYEMPKDASAECVMIHDPASDVAEAGFGGFFLLAFGCLFLMCPLMGLKFFLKEKFCPDGSRFCPWCFGAVNKPGGPTATV